ncbi:HD domain-containing protein [Lutimonas sp.]|uniref:HD domain-containing protein n=1 Tax=Lutimonas sp. TaxID=1872403 RepID=UPI003D9ADD7E
MKGYYKLRKIILDILNTKLSKDLHYHGVHHTVDALNTCSVYLKHNKISNHEAKLLRLGVLLHDIGFTETTKEHEKKSAEIADKLLSENGISEEDKSVIEGLILSTKIPQQPKTLLEKIICDVDLDYLGRADFYAISNQLFQELKALDVLDDFDDWNKLQIRFLEAHTYHTEFAIQNRQPEKELRIAELKKLVG